MKRIIGIVILAMLTFTGCSKVITTEQIDTPAETGENLETEITVKPDQAVSPTSYPTVIPTQSPTVSPTGSPCNYVKTYDNETHKEIQYDKLSFNTRRYHITSESNSDGIITYKCEIDKEEVSPRTDMTIQIREIRKQEFFNKDSIISYLSDMLPNYANIMVYNTVTNDYGIISLYTVTGGGLTNYLVNYNDACYLIESDYSSLDFFLFQKFATPDYEINIQNIECADSFTTNFSENISYDDQKVEYDIFQGKNEINYSAELRTDDEYNYIFTLNNEEGGNLLTLYSDAQSIADIVNILDVNMDGYADIQFTVAEGSLNCAYELYVWDDSADNFVKVKCDEMLSDFEVHDGYLLNYGKNDSESGVIQKLVWDSNTLILESEEEYHAD
jgi:hypothetical protein